MNLLKLFKRKSFAVYDIAYLPEGETIESLLEKFKQTNVLIYDSNKMLNKGIKTDFVAPKIVNI